MTRPLAYPTLALAFASLASVSGAQESRAVFDCGMVTLPFNVIPYTALLDFDGDGDLDAVGDWTEDQFAAFIRVGLFENDGNGVLAPTGWAIKIEDAGSMSVFPLETQIATGDLNGDGKDDFVLANGGFVHVYHGTATEVVLAQELLELPDVHAVEILDADGDGTPEIALLTAAGLGWMTQSGGTWSVSTWVRLPDVLPGSSAHRIEATGDGVDDLVLVTGSRIIPLTWIDGAFVALANASQVGSANAGFPRHGMTTPHVAAGDVTGDGLDDVVLFAGTSAQGYRIFRQLRPGRFVLDPQRPGGPATDFADIDGDGDLDGVCCGGPGDGPKPDLFFESNFELSLNDGTGGFADSFRIRGSGAEHLAGAADIDGDGDVDLVAGRVIVYGDGFAGHPRTETGVFVVQPGAATDYDMDGDIDLEFGRISVIANTGGDELVPTAVLKDAPPAGTTFAGNGIPGDFDGDGDRDLLVEHRQGGFFLSMRLLSNDGTGYLVDAGAATGPGIEFQNGVLLDASDVRLFDFDDDGDLDVITNVRGTSNDGSSLWANDGNGFFTLGLDLRSQVPPIFDYRNVLHVADFTNDGVADLLVIGPAGLGLRLGLGAGAFDTEYRPFPSAGSQFFNRFDSIYPTADSFAVDDFDDNGWLDVIAIEAQSLNTGNDVYFLRNLGPTTPGFFSMYEELDTEVFDTIGNAVKRNGSAPRHVRGADVNGDGRTDIVVQPLNYQDDAALVILNTGSEPLSWGTGTIQHFEAEHFADMDGDGDLDGLSTVVTKNRTLSPPSQRLLGRGAPGAGGVVPTLVASGPLTTGEPVTLELGDGLADARAFLVLSDRRTPRPNFPAAGITLYPDLEGAFTALLTTRLDASGRAAFALPIVPALLGTEWTLQLSVRDPAGNGGWAMSPALALRFAR